MIKLLCVGRLKERFYSDAASELVKRISRYDRLEVIEVSDEKAPETLCEKERAIVMDAEGERLLARLAEGDYVIALTPRGRELSSEEFSQKLESLHGGGKSRIAFLIGGSLGLSEAALARSDMCLSFSPMTFPHQLFRVMLLEQIYRAYKIMKNEPYHK